MTVTVTPTVEPTNVPPRVRLDVSASAGETSCVVTRLNADGTKVQVRTGGTGNALTISAGTALLYDYEVPFQTLVSFSTQESPATVSGQVSLAVNDVWLIHPAVPVRSVKVHMRPGSLAKEVFAVSRGVFYPAGRRNAVVQTDGARKGSQSSITVSTETLDELRALNSLLADAGPVLLNIPATMETGFDAQYVAFGDVELDRWTAEVIDGNRDWVLPFAVVDRPAGGGQSLRTYAVLKAAYAGQTYADLKTAYAGKTYLDLQAG